MNDELGYLPIPRKTGQERLHRAGRPLERTVLGFWQWARSDLLGNTDRGVLAEYLVALDLGVADGARDAFATYDLKTKEGVRIEVKSSAYVQSWKQKRLSLPGFGVAPTQAWDPETDVFDETKRRQADVYVFAVLANQDQATIDPLDLAQWEFYVLPTRVLDERLPDQQRVTLDAVVSLGAEKVEFGGILSAVGRAGEGR